MKLPTLYRIVLTLLLAGLPLAGCVKKPPQPPPAPPVSEKQEPVPTPPVPAPKEEPAPTPAAAIGSGDFQPVFFDFDAYTLREDGRTALDRDAKLLRDNAGLRVTVEGHCDERGTAEYNQALGERRAQAARDYLVAAGIATSRMDVVSYGKERPFSEGHDEAGWQQNRRAHFVIRQ